MMAQSFCNHARGTNIKLAVGKTSHAIDATLVGEVDWLMFCHAYIIPQNHLTYKAFYAIMLYKILLTEVFTE